MKVRNTIKEFAIITVGTAIVAAAVFFFMLPSHVSAKIRKDIHLLADKPLLT